MKMPFVLLFAFLAALYGCKKDQHAGFDLQEAYFPITEGHYVTYRVREVKIDQALDQNDTTDYFLKTVIGAIETDNSGRQVRRFERYVRFDQAEPWMLKDIWTTLRDGQRVELVEENQRVIKLVLAPDKVKEWDMNAYNTLGEMNCYYDNIHDPATINGMTFDSTVTVIQQDVFNFIEFRNKSEVYAKGVGLVKKAWKDFSINNGNAAQIVSGSEISMEVLSYGKE